MLYAYTDVQLGGTLVFGAPAATHSTIATMTINAQAPSPSMVSGVEVFVYIYSLCGNSLQVTSPSYTGSITLDDRCSGTVDLLAVQDTSEFADETWGPYQFLPAQPIVDGGFAPATLVRSSYSPLLIELTG